MIVYGGNRDIEAYYMLPFIPFLPLQSYLGDTDNEMLGFSLTYKIKEIHIYLV